MGEALLGVPLQYDPVVIRSLVLPLEPGDEPARLSHITTRTLSQLLRDGRDQRDQGWLVVGLDGQDIAADTIGLPRLTQETIAFRFGEGGCNPLR